MALAGVAAIVTGGASRLGGATAARLAKAGAKVTIFDLNAELGQALAQEIGGLFLSVNVVDEALAREAIAQAEAEHGVSRALVTPK